MNLRPAPAHARSARTLTTLLIALLLLAKSSPAFAQATWVGNSADLKTKVAKKANSYVVTSDKTNLWDGVTPYGGTNFPAAMNTFPGPDVDVVMQQCFGGGFAEGMNAAITKYTFSAAANWNETAITTGGGNNFTSSWVQSFPRNQGLYTHWTDTVNGAAALVGPPPRPAVVADPYGPSGASRNVPAEDFENPVFASPDALLGGGGVNAAGVNNGRDIVTNNQWAVLMAFQPDAPRFGTNIDRVYNALRGISIPADHIIVLFGGNAANTATAGGTPINGGVTLANVTNAVKTGTGLYGNITGQTAPTAPQPNTDHLFVYTTGHGNSWTKPGGTVVVNPGTKKVTVTKKPANGYRDFDGSETDLGFIDLEIAFPSHVSPVGASLVYNGIPLGSPIIDSGLSPLVDLTSMVGTSYYWTVSVPLSLVNSFTASPVDVIDINGLSLGDPSPVAFTYNNYFDAWSVGLEAVPEPTACVLFATALAAGALRRKRSLA